MSSNIIEINGNQYDASSGRLINDTQHTASPLVAHNSSKSPGGQTIDGFSKRPSHSLKPTHEPAPASHAIHAKTTKSKTLMRHAVKKPVPAPTHTQHSGIPPVRKQPAGIQTNPARAGRATHVHKSSLISKFGSFTPGVTKLIQPLEVRPAPTHNGAAPAITPATTHTAASADPIPSSNPFDLAIQNAEGHKQPKIKKPSFRNRTAQKLRVSPRALNIAAGVFITLFVGGIIAYRSIPQLALQMASNRSGVRARLPAYRPSGYSLSGPVHYTNGEVTLNYGSNSDERNFRVVQKSTDWNSQALLDNFVTAKENVATFNDKGRTVFIYDGNNATWVDGGVWYQIEGEESLSSDQLRRIVSGL